jgi:hypothetical protein
VIGTTPTDGGNRPGSVVILLAAVGCALAISACGSSSSSSGAAGGSSLIKFASCMRSHGVPNFPDPSPGGGLKIDASTGINPQSPAFQSAQTACSKLMPGGGPLRRPLSEPRKLAMLRLAQCMRRHGVSGFPDPSSTPPSKGPGPHTGIAFGAPGSFIAVPQAMLQSPGFRQAATACEFPGAGPGGGAKSQAPAP